MEKKIKVLWFTNTPSLAEKETNNKIFGGGWIMSLEAAIKKYVDNVLLYVVFEGKNDKSFEYDGTKYFSVKGVKTNVLQRKFFLSRKESKNDAYQLPKYLKIIEEVKPDVIHVHGSEKNFGLVSSHVQIPVVISIQGLLTVYKHKYFGGIYDAQIKKSNIPRFVINQHLSYVIRSKRELKMIESTNYFFGRTFWDRNIVHMINPQSRYYLINEIMREKFYSLNWKFNRNETGPIILVSTMRDNVYKGFETILFVSRILKDRGVLFRWKIAGVTKDNYLVKMFRKEFQKVEEHINLLGSLDEEGLSKHLCDSDMYIQASRIENSPNGLVEAMLIGMPCIATYVGGTGSLITHYKDGILVQDGDAWIMAGVIKELINNKELAFELAKNAKNTAQKRNNSRKVALQIHSAYQNIIEHFNNQSST